MKTTKKLVAILLMVLIISAAFAGCGNPITAIKFKETQAKSRIEQKYQIEYTIEPSGIENPKIEWTSSNEKIATVNESGLVTCIAEGDVEITATAKKDVTATCKLKVGPKVCTETKQMKIDGVYVDNSYKDKNGSSKKLVYFCYTIKAPESNLQVTSVGTHITIDEKNTYESERITNKISTHKYMQSYYFSKVYKDVNVGESLKVMETFLIPAADLKAGKMMAFSDFDFELKDEFLMPTDDIVFCKNGTELAKKADPEGFKTEVGKRKAADAATTNKVKSQLNGYYWTFYVNNSTYKVEFFEPNDFEITVSISGSGIRNSGTYSVRKGYIFLNYGDGNDPAVTIPYTFKSNGEIDLDTITAFSVY